MKKLLLNLALLATISISLNACLHNEEEEDTVTIDPSKLAVGTMTATVDGAAWESKPFFGQSLAYAYVDGGYLTVTGSAISGTTDVTGITFQVTGYDGPGTYTLGLDGTDYAFASYILINATTQASTVHVAGYDDVNSVGSGQIIVSTEEEVDGKTVITGTFSFTTGRSVAVAADETETELADASIEVKNGAFKLTSE